MPFYLYQHPKTEQIIEVMQSCKDKHEFIDSEGVQWNRVWTVPNASVDNCNDGTEEGFMRYTQDKAGTIGDLWDASKESSEKRKQRYGEDKVQQKFFKDYSQKRKGLKHEKERGNGDITL
jgi:AMMECR1 domain-containing protein|tara:strand:- start:6655 stop:7014 length:360 start_codon:yes stop_codon:yes gene_type:complete